MKIDSDTLEVKQVTKQNKGLFTKNKVMVWSTVLQCEPICTSVSMSYRNRYCNFCFMQKQVQRCSSCKVHYYCSKTCQSDDWKIHKKQCSSLRCMLQKGLDPSKINMQMLLNLRMWIIRSHNDKIDKQINNMCNFIQFQYPEKLSQYQQTGVMLIQMLKIQKNQQNLSKMIKQQCSLALNCFTIQDYLCSQNSIGLGIYWPANFINHDCHPNCSQIFDGRYLKIIANRQIQPNQQISISYVPVLESWENKRKLLRQGYLFQCFCDQCQVNKMFQQNLMYLKCPFCNQNKIYAKNDKSIVGQQIVPQNKGPQQMLKKCQIQCRNCKRSIDVQIVNQIISKANENIAHIQKQNASYKQIKKSLLQLRKVISMSDSRMSQCLSIAYMKSLQEAAQDKKIYSQSYILVKQMIQNAPQWYRLNPQDQIPYSLVWKYAEAGKLAYLLEKYKKACQYTEKSHEIISKIKFRNDFLEVKQLKQRYQQMKIGLSFNKAQIFRKSN